MPQVPDIVYADQDLLVVEKPPGLLTVPGKGPDKQDCLISRLLVPYPNARIVHRLDQPTSGLVIIPLNHPTQKHIGRQFEQRQVGKAYIAVVSGRVEPERGEVDVPLICDWPNRPRQKVDYTQGKAALTRFEVLERNDHTTRLLLSPMTGRSHQLRVHMQWLGHPILGDTLYADKAGIAASNRLLLHAARLNFRHPATGDALDLHSEPGF